MNTPTETLINSLQILANDIQSEDGVANAAIAESAKRMEEMDKHIETLRQRMSVMDDDALLANDIWETDRSIKRDLSQQIEKLERELNVANNHIARLEEAGDKMALILNSTRERWHSSNQCEAVAFEWNEAKETKP